MTSWKERHSIEFVAKRFWEKVKKTSNCWVWIACTNKPGYGQMSVGGRNGRPQLAHRISWMIHNGPLEEGICVLHKCDNPPCVRPDHLFLGDRMDNRTDMIRKGRNPDNQVYGTQGETHYNARLSEKDVNQIRKRFSNGEKQKNLAKEYRCTQANISRIVKGHNWKHI